MHQLNHCSMFVVYFISLLYNINSLKLNGSVMLSAVPNFLKSMDVFNVHRIPHVYRFINIMCLNFSINKFSIKAMLSKVKGRYFHQSKYVSVIIYADFIALTFL